MIDLRFATSSEWTRLVLKNFDRFLADHAAAEKKAAGMAMSMLSHYPDRPELVAAMADLAVEETSHFRDVLRLMRSRGVQMAGDEKDPYVNRFRQNLRPDSDDYLLDRLLIGGVIEARGCERFGLIAKAATDPRLQRFYHSIGQSESRHAELFVELAKRYFASATVTARLDELLDREAVLISELPYRPALH